MLLLLALFFVGETWGSGEPFPIIQLTAIEQVEMLATAIMTLGVLAAWQRELVGGSVSIAGGLLFLLAESIDAGQFSLVWFPTVFLLVGVLFVLCWLADWKDVENRVRSA
jgi:hypothetical protein